jgi:hypothetical protein
LIGFYIDSLASDTNPIYVLVRDESSGSTNILTEYFINASPTWNATYGPVPLNVFPNISFISKRYLGDVMVSGTILELNQVFLSVI